MAALADMTSEPDSVLEFASAVREFVDVIEGDVAGLQLLRDLRRGLADLYAAALRLPEPPRGKRAGQNIELVTESKGAAIMTSLEMRLPKKMYWSALLPLTYETVGDFGVNELADEVREIYGWLVPGLALMERNGPRAEVEDWWANWEVSWGWPGVRCMAILHEVITDLEMNIYGRSSD
jgi:hypothetical protein